MLSEPMPVDDQEMRLAERESARRAVLSLVPVDLDRREVVPVGFSDEVLAVALAADDPGALWNDATTLAGAITKWSALGYETTELEASRAFLEIVLGDRLGPRPGALPGPGRGLKNESHEIRFEESIPQARRSELRLMHGFQDRLVAYVREVRDEKGRVPSRRQLLVLCDRWRASTNGTSHAAAGDLPDGVRLFDHDARQRWPLDDETVDLIVTSPPYGLDVAYPDGDVPADLWPSFMADWLRQAYRVTKLHGRLALNVPLDTSEPTYRPTYAETVVAAMMAGWAYASTIVWADNQTKKGGWALGSQSSAARPRHVSQVEMVLLASKGPWEPSSAGRDDVTPKEFLLAGRGPWTFTGETKAWEGHPAPFPLELPRRLIPYLSRVGDTVLDPFCGSGTTLVAAVERGRQAIGFDISAVYVESARRRLAGS